jgi:hypothetical protein
MWIGLADCPVNDVKASLSQDLCQILYSTLRHTLVYTTPRNQTTAHTHNMYLYVRASVCYVRFRCCDPSVTSMVVAAEGAEIFRRFGGGISWWTAYPASSVVGLFNLCQCPPCERPPCARPAGRRRRAASVSCHIHLRCMPSDECFLTYRKDGRWQSSRTVECNSGFLLSVESACARARGHVLAGTEA